MYAIMLETDYVKKERFNRNFWAGFQQVLGKHHVIKGLEKCNFRPMYEHFMAEREAKKALDKEVGSCVFSAIFTCGLRVPERCWPLTNPVQEGNLTAKLQF